MSKAPLSIRLSAERAIRHLDSEDRDAATVDLLHAVFWIGQALEDIETRLAAIEKPIGIKGALGLRRKPKS